MSSGDEVTFRPGRFHAFLTISAMLIGGVTAFSGLLVGRFFERQVLAHEERHTASVVQNQARQHLSPDAFTRAAAHGDPAFHAFLEGLPGVFRVKAFDAQGTIVWSNEPRLIGQTFPDNVYVGQALAGRVMTVLEQPRRAEHVFERSRDYVAEAYVPVVLPGQSRPIGVVETYTDVTETMAAIALTQRRIWAVGGGLGALLYVALAFVVWRASVSERRAMTRLEHQNRELWLIQRFTNSVLVPLDVESLARNVVTAAGEGLGLAAARLYRVRPAEAPVLLAAWPPGAGRPAPPLDLSAVVTSRQAAVTGATAVMPVPTPDQRGYVFVADFAGPTAGAGSRPLGTLEIMLAEAAIGLSNVDLFTEIREAHRRLAAILAGVADRMVIVDRDMRVVWMNPAAEAGHEDGAEVIGLPCFEAFGVDAQACHGCPALRAFGSGTVERGVRVQRVRGGDVRYLDLVAAPLRDEGGAVRQVLEVARDITELVEMEERLKQTASHLEESHREVVAKAEQLERTNQALREAQAQLVESERLAAVGDLVVSLHHAILNPLTGILGALQVLRQETSLAPGTREALEAAEAEIRKIEQLVRRLPALRRATGTPYVGTTTMLDLEQADPAEGPTRPGGPWGESAPRSS